MTLLSPDRTTPASDSEELLRVRVASHPPVQRVEIEGELDLATVDQLTDTMRRIAAGEGACVEVSLAGLRFIGGCGVGALLSSRELVTGRGKSFTITSLSPVSRWVIELTGTAGRLGIDESTVTEPGVAPADA